MLLLNVQEPADDSLTDRATCRRDKAKEMWIGTIANHWPLRVRCCIKSFDVALRLRTDACGMLLNEGYKPTKLWLCI